MIKSLAEDNDLANKELHEKVDAQKKMTMTKVNDMGAALDLKIGDHHDKLAQHTDDIAAVTEKADGLINNLEQFQSDSKKKMASLKKGQNKLVEGQEAADAAIKETGEKTNKMKGKLKDPDDVVE